MRRTGLGNHGCQQLSSLSRSADPSLISSLALPDLGEMTLCHSKTVTERTSIYEQGWFGLEILVHEGRPAGAEVHCFQSGWELGPSRTTGGGGGPKLQPFRNGLVLWGLSTSARPLSSAEAPEGSQECLKVGPSLQTLLHREVHIMKEPSGSMCPSSRCL